MKMDAALAARPPLVRTVWRTTMVDDVVFRSINSGPYYKDKAYLSSSNLPFDKMKLEYRQRNCYWTIESKSGRSLLDCYKKDHNGKSPYGDEQDILFPRNTTFKILKMHKSQLEAGTWRYHIHMEEEM